MYPSRSFALIFDPWEQIHLFWMGQRTCMFNGSVLEDATDS